METIYIIDDNGNMITTAGEYVGYYDTELKACILYNGQQTPCPANMKEPKAQPVVKSSKTFYWVIALGLILAIIIISYLVKNRAA